MTLKTGLAPTYILRWQEKEGERIQAQYCDRRTAMELIPSLFDFYGFCVTRPPTHQSVINLHMEAPE